MPQGYDACEYCVKRKPFNRPCVYTSPFMYSTRCMSLVPGDLGHKATRQRSKVQTVCTASTVRRHDNIQAARWMRA